jgi:uncharacterized protein YktB (UPF0637 family)
MQGSRKQKYCNSSSKSMKAIDKNIMEDIKTSKDAMG